MTNINVISNRRSLMFKINMTFLDTTPEIQRGKTTYNGIVYPEGTYYVLPSGSQYEDVEEFGICYYTTNVNDIIYIPFNTEMFLYHTDSENRYGGKIWILPCELKRENNLSIKVRETQNYPLFCLLEGLTEETTYHISAYYKKINEDKIILGYNTVTTKPRETYKVTFSETTITTFPSAFESQIQNCKNMMDDILPKTANMLNDCVEFTQDYNYNPTLYWQVGGAGAYSDMRFNGWYLDTEDDIRSITIHELEHNFYKGHGSASGEFDNSENSIKFIEFATDIEGARIGRIGNHYYPVISSYKFDYLDDYLICMSSDTNFLLGETQFFSTQ